jgi:two-component system nitrate/nitrite response regulator NarL
MPTTDHPSIRVLLVDDHRTVLWGLGKLIDSAKPRMHVVGTAVSADEALALAVAERPDVVLLDLDLGGSSGLEILSDLLGRCDAKVLILTGARDSELRERAVLQGASGMVHKAEPAEVILNAVERVAYGEVWLDRVTTAKLLASLSDPANGKQKAANDAIAALTHKERDIIIAVVRHKGAPIKVIAETLCLSSHTVRNHLASIYSKLGVHNRLDLFMYAKERGLDRSAA